MLTINPYQSNLNLQNYAKNPSFKAATRDYADLYAKMQAISKSLKIEPKEFTIVEVNKQIQKIRRNAPQKLLCLYENIKKTTPFDWELKNIDTYLEFILSNKNKDIYYSEFLAKGHYPSHDNFYNSKSVGYEGCNITLPRCIGQALTCKKNIENLSEEQLSERLCKLAESPNVNVNELIINEGFLTGQTFTSEITNYLLLNNGLTYVGLGSVPEDFIKFNAAKDFIKTVTQRDDYHEASRDLYSILTQPRKFSTEMIDIIDMLMEHESFNPNYVDNYYTRGMFESDSKMEYRSNPKDTLAYAIINFDKYMKTDYFKKLSSHPNFKPTEVTKYTWLHPKNAHEMRKAFLNI